MEKNIRAVLAIYSCKGTGYNRELYEFNPREDSYCVSLQLSN